MRIFWIEDGAAQKEEYFPPDIIEKYEIYKKGKKFEDIVNVINTNEIVKYDFFVVDLDLRDSDIEKSDSAKLFMKKHKRDPQDHNQQIFHYLCDSFDAKFSVLRITLSLTYNSFG